MTFDIEAELARRNGDFISLDEVLTTLAALGNGTYQKAAEVLLGWLHETDELERPDWVSLELTGVHGGNTQAGRGKQCLKQAALNGIPAESDYDDLPF